MANTTPLHSNNTVHKYLNPLGYGILKESLNERELKDLKARLTVKPFTPIEKYDFSQPFPVYRESVTRLYIPKAFGIKEYGEPDLLKQRDGNDIDVAFTGGLRDYQLGVMEKVKAAYQLYGGGLLCMKCGEGKTVMAIYAITQVVKKKALVIVHKEFLLQQWVDRLKQFAPGIRIGRIQGPTIETDCDVAIGMLQSLSFKDYDPKVFDSFGHVVVDECHHIAAQSFSKALQKTQCKYMLGLSATPERKDGLTCVLEWYFGGIIHRSTTRPKGDLVVECVHSLRKVPLEKDDVLPVMVNKLAEDMMRSILVADTVVKVFQRDDAGVRKVLVLSERLSLLRWLATTLLEKMPGSYMVNDYDPENENQTGVSVGWYVGGMKQVDLTRAEGADILLSTYVMTAEGFDVPALNTLVLATPINDIEQTAGRITRKVHEVPAIIYDVIDMKMPKFKGRWPKRRAYYNKMSYTIINTPDKPRKSKKETEDVDEALMAEHADLF